MDRCEIRKIVKQEIAKALDAKKSCSVPIHGYFNDTDMESGVRLEPDPAPPVADKEKWSDTLSLLELLGLSSFETFYAADQRVGGKIHKVHLPAGTKAALRKQGFYLNLTPRYETD